MKRIRVIDCLSNECTRVVASSCPIRYTAKTVFAVFDTLDYAGHFLGLVVGHDIAMNQQGTFGELVCHRPPQQTVIVDATAERVLGLMARRDMDVVAVLNIEGFFLGVVYQVGVLDRLYQREHALNLGIKKHSQWQTKTHMKLLEQVRTAQQQVYYLEHHDRLTGFPIASQLQETLERAIHLHGVTHHYALLSLDVDELRVVNNRIGPFFGDVLLKHIAARIAGNIGANGSLARKSGGDGFVIVLSHLLFPYEAAQIARSILNAFALPFTLNSQLIYLTMSIGISLCPQDSQESETLLRYAGIALSYAISLGRNNYQFFTEGLNEQVLSEAKQEGQLREATGHNEWLLYYQPIVNAINQRIIGAEALLRWNNPERGLILPANFIPLAEKMKLIVSMDHWVLQMACQQIKQWLRYDQSLRISVNLSALHFESNDRRGQHALIKIVMDTLERYNLAPDCLELEITETAMIKNYDVALSVMKKLKNIGVRLACDDFGAGFSSLNHLKKFPIDTLKIDESFTRGMVNSAVDLAIVRGIIYMAKELSITVIAEGVETSEQLHILNDLGCTTIQGYCFSKPLPVEALTQLLSRGFLFDNVR